MASGLNRIDVVVSSASTSALADRDAVITDFKAAYPGTWGFYHYVDSASGWTAWSYLAVGRSTTNGITTVVTISMGGKQTVPSGSKVAATNDPGLGVSFTWLLVGAPLSIRTSSDGSGGSVPAGNNNYYVWDISPTSSTAAADFTTAVTAVEASLASSLLGGAVQKKYLKYVDAVSGAWQVSAIYFGAGCAEFGTTSTVSVLPNNNILYVVTCAGTPHPMTGSGIAVVSPAPTFTQTFTTITAPLNFGPTR